MGVFPEPALDVIRKIADAIKAWALATSSSKMLCTCEAPIGMARSG